MYHALDIHKKGLMFKGLSPVQYASGVQGAFGVQINMLLGCKSNAFGTLKDMLWHSKRHALTL